MRGVMLVMHQLVLERGPEGLNTRVVLAVALAAHADGHALRRQQLLIVIAGIPHATIAVMQEAPAGLATGISSNPMDGLA